MRRKRRKKRNLSKFILIFAITLSIVLLAGLAGILAYGYVIQEDNRSGQDSNMPMVSLIEKIPLDSMTQTDKEQEEGNQNLKYGQVLADAAYMSANRIYTRDAAAEGEVRLCFAGDILFDREYAVMATALQRGGTVEQAFSSAVRERMQQADIMMVNNEFPYTDRGAATEEKQFTFRASPEYVSWLDDMSIDIVSLANNHTFDYGEAGLLDSLEALEGVGIPYAGAGRNLEEAASPVYYIVNDIKIAFISATQIERLDNPDTRGATETLPGVFRCWNPAKLCEVVEEAKENSDFVVVYIHWGTENVNEPDWAQLDQAPKIAAAGADLIVGSHPHCLQGITYCGNTPVIYSLGNFWFSSRTVDTGMLEVVLDEEGIKTVQFIPALQSDCTTTILNGAEKSRVLVNMRSMSSGVQIDEDGFISIEDKTPTSIGGE